MTVDAARLSINHGAAQINSDAQGQGTAFPPWRT